LHVLGLSPSKFYDWQKRLGKPNRHNGKVPRDFWLETWETEAIINFKSDHPDEGYRRLTYMMLDRDIVAVSPSTTYRVLKAANLLNKWNTKALTKNTGFNQPEKPHQHWHTDISYVNFLGTYLFLISVLDGYSRFNLYHELRRHMTEYDVQMVIQTARDLYPAENPNLITDNGSQFLAKDFKEFIRENTLKHIRTSVRYPQSNGKIESFHKSIKKECIRRQSFLSIEDARNRVAEWIDEYNFNRLHSAIGYVTPNDMMLGRAASIFKERDRKLQEARERRKANYHNSKTRAFSPESPLTNRWRGVGEKARLITTNS
jgi:transposase InsO family protein